AAPGKRGLGNGLGLVRRILGLGVDQDHFKRRVLEYALEGLRLDEPHRKHRRMQHQRDAERKLQGAQGTERGGEFHGAAGGAALSASFMSTAMAIGPATASSSSSAACSAASAAAAPAAALSGLSRRSISVPLTSSVISSISPRRSLMRAPRGRPWAPSTGSTSGSDSARTRKLPPGPSLMTLASISVMPFCSRYLSVQKRSMPAW